MKVRWKTITLGFLASLGVILYLHPNIDLKARHFIDSLFTNKRDAIDLPNSAIAKEEVGLNKAQETRNGFRKELITFSISLHHSLCRKAGKRDRTFVSYNFLFYAILL